MRALPCSLLGLFLCCQCVMSDQIAAAPLTVPSVLLANGAFYLDAQPFWVKGIGYSPCRPGQHPWKEGNYSPEHALREDMRRIKAAGFNTLRSWMEMPDYVYEMAADEGLQVLAGISLPLEDMCDPAFRAQAVDVLTKEVGRLRKHPNIIGYLVINEPEVEYIETTDPACVKLFFSELVAVSHALDPFRPITCTPWAIMWPTDMSDWDLLTYNIYRYYPSVVSTNMTYARFIAHIRNEKAQGRPFIVTEFGYPVNSAGAGGFTYGGNSLEEQADGIVDLINALVAGGAAGGCVFEWNDEWWKPFNMEGDEFSHEDDPEEYFGLIAFTNAADMIGTPRPAYYAISNRYQALTVSPARQVVYTSDVPVQVYTAHEQADGALEFMLDARSWEPLTADRLWQTGVIPFSGLQSGGHTVSVQRVDNGATQIIDQITFYTCPPDELMQQQLSLSIMPPLWAPGSPLWLVAQVNDPLGQPIENWPVKISTLQTRPIVDTHYEGVTDPKGQYRIQITPDGAEDSHLLVWAACDTQRGACPDHTVAMKVIPFKEAPPHNPDDYVINIPYCEKKPEIDGKREKMWGETPLVDLSLPEKGAAHVLIRGYWEGNNDFSGQIYARWDDENLYLLADVRDASPAQNKWHNAEIWRGDGLEIFLGINTVRDDESRYSDTDFQFILAPDEKTWIYGQALGGTRDASVSGVDIAVLPDNEGYVLEACVPWKNFAFVPHDGDEINVEFNLNNMVEGQGLPTKIFWATDGTAYRSPKGWGRAVLMPE